MTLTPVRRLELSLQFSVACMATLGTILLGLGQQSHILPTLAVFSSTTSFLLTDLLCILVLRQWMTNGLMIAALILVVFDVMRSAGFIHVLSMADLLVYLQCILQFQTKNTRVFRYLVTLSAFQVVSASAFYHSVLFGTLLALYLLISLMVMLLLAFYESWQVQNDYGGPANRKQPPAWHTFVGDRIYETSPLGFNGRLLGRILGLGLASLGFAAVVFAIVPRLSSQPWPGIAPSPLRTVGFDRQVSLGELGFLLEDRTPVMRAEIMDMDGNPVSVAGPVYLRGGCYPFYRNGQWEINPFVMDGQVQNLKPLYRGLGQSLHRQRIILEPLDTADVFAIWPYGQWDDAPLVYDASLTRLFRLSDRPQRVSYELVTSAIENQRLVDIVPAVDPVIREQYLQLPWFRWVSTWFGPRLQMDEQMFAEEGWNRVVELARTWAEKSPWPASDHYRTARFFEQQLAISGYYRYSLAGVSRNEDLDPVVDFLTEHKEGHCEYFATALALLLRCRGIPTRIVIGYKTYDYNTLGHFYQVRQSDAHAWVEVYLSPEQITEEIMGNRPMELFRLGGWLRLDPTPLSASGLATTQSAWQRVWNTYNFLDHIWLKYVMQMDQPRQETAIYRPVREQVRKRVNRIFDLQEWKQRITVIGKQLRNIFGTPARAAGIAGALALVAVLVWRIRRVLQNPVWLWWMAGFLPRRLRTTHFSEHLATTVYRRLERLLEQQGYQRFPGQTPLQFVISVVDSVQKKGGQCPWGTTAIQIVSKYYQLRFGTEQGEISHFEQCARALARLENHLSKRERPWWRKHQSRQTQ
ncbi:MAG: transglutaminase TgpA family protein [Thermogutta sp.]